MGVFPFTNSDLAVKIWQMEISFEGNVVRNNEQRTRRTQGYAHKPSFTTSHRQSFDRYTGYMVFSSSSKSHARSRMPSLYTTNTHVSAAEANSRGSNWGHHSLIAIGCWFLCLITGRALDVIPPPQLRCELLGQSRESAAACIHDFIASEAWPRCCRCRNSDVLHLTWRKAAPVAFRVYFDDRPRLLCTAIRWIPLDFADIRMRLIRNNMRVYLVCHERESWLNAVRVPNYYRRHVGNHTHHPPQQFIHGTTYTDVERSRSWVSMLLFGVNISKTVPFSAVVTIKHLQKVTYLGNQLSGF